MTMTEYSIWKRDAAGIALVGAVLALGNATPIVGVDGAGFQAASKCGQPITGFMPVYNCQPWTTVFSDPLSISPAPLLLPLVLLTYAALWLRGRFARKLLTTTRSE